jgi:isopentenyldiphosphate isomerase
MKSHDPGKWGPAVAGTLEEGETYESNAHKEAFEELGLTDITLEVGPKQHSTSRRNFFGQWFICRLDKSVTEFVLQKEEVEQVAWVKKVELVKDLQANPDKYVPSLRWVIDELIGY